MTLWICVLKCPKAKNPTNTWEEKWRDGQSEKACVKLKDPWHFNKWEQAHYNAVADGELVGLNWYPPCENKWVSEWMGWAPNWYSPHQNKWVKGWVGPNWYPASENKMRESSTLRLQLKDPPEPIRTKCTRDEQRIPTQFNKGKPLVSEWVCTNGCATLRRA